MTIREESERLEELILSPFAAFSKNSRGRALKERDIPPEHDLRTVYQRDRDRLIHCKSFRRLKHKTQVFLSPEGDHYRTRLTHTLEVSQIARTIAKALRLNEDLTEAAALGHDLGHTPFGHAGERALNAILPDGFRHYEQSVRVVDKLEKDGRGLNLTYEVRDGIRCHTSGTEADTMEGKILRWADKIAYMNHDVDDAIRAGMLNEDDMPDMVKKRLGNSKTERITTLISSMIKNSGSGLVGMGKEEKEAFDELHAFLYESVYLNDYAKSEEKKVPYIIESLFRHFIKTHHLPPLFQAIAEKDGVEIAAADYISGMTDHYAIEVFRDIYIPKAWNG